MEICYILFDFFLLTLKKRDLQFSCRPIRKNVDEFFVFTFALTCLPDTRTTGSRIGKRIRLEGAELLLTTIPN